MKKILYSASAIVAVAAMVLYSTGAFFSDTETSTGNVFTAGAIDLKIDSVQHYNGMVCVSIPQNGYQWAPEQYVTLNSENQPEVTTPYVPAVWNTANPTSYPKAGTACTGTWPLQDLGNGQVGSPQFFNFTDIKPGDEGENTISLHVINNDAWVCAEVADLVNSNNGTTEPESTAVGNTPGGDLQNAMVWKIWRDDGAGVGGVAGDNIQNGTEQTLAQGQPVEGVLAVYDATTGTGPLLGATTGYIGVSWSLPSTVGNEVQTDSMTGDISFTVVQSRNNANYVCDQSQTPGRPTVGALLSAYTAPTTCDVTVDDTGSNPAFDTIQEGIDAATAGQTVCVKAGTYTQDVNINKSLTLAGDGPALTSLTGVGTGYGGALTVASGVDNVTIKGFTVNGTGESAVYLTSNNDNVNVLYNRIVAATGKNAVLSGGQETNSTLSNNVFEGSGSQLVYINGAASLGAGNASSNVDFTSNTFGGSATGPLLGMEATGSSVTLNKFSGTTSYTSLESFAGDLLVNQNNFNVVGQMHVKNGDVGTLNAENNWWGDTTPADNVTGLVDFTPSEASAFPQN